MRLNYQRLFHQLILALSRVLDIDGSRKLTHAQRTAVLSAMLADEFCPGNKPVVYYAALLHDIGGIGLFDHIVHHPSPVMQAANTAIRVHPVIGAQIVNGIPGLEPCVPFILDHHEFYDGHGFPRGKRVEQLTLGAQVLRAADSFDILVRNAGKGKESRLSKAFAGKAGREISAQLADFVCSCIQAPERLSLLLDDAQIEQECLKLHDELPGFHLPRGWDVIGSLLEVFAQVIDTKHSYTAGHSQRVARYSIHIGLELGLEHDEITKLKWAALIHDLGKVAVPKSILDGATVLNRAQFELIKQHPKYTREVLSCVTELAELGHIGALHHERWDGKGYPDGLRGERIPLLSRIICVADAFDSLTSDRAYRRGVGSAEAIATLARAAGSQFDPEVFAVARAVLWSGRE